MHPLNELFRSACTTWGHVGHAADALRMPILTTDVQYLAASRRAVPLRPHTLLPQVHFKQRLQAAHAALPLRRAVGQAHPWRQHCSEPLKMRRLCRRPQALLHVAGAVVAGAGD